MSLRRRSRLRLLAYSAIAALALTGVAPLAAPLAATAAEPELLTYSSIAVTDVDGNPIPNVHVSGYRGDAGAFSGVSDANGRLDFSTLVNFSVLTEPTPAYLSVYANVQGWTEGSFTWDGTAFVPSSASVTPAAVLLSQTGGEFAATLPTALQPVSISGTVTSAGNGLSGANIYAFTPDGTYVARSSAATDGSYQFRGLAVGSYKLSFNNYETSTNQPFGYAGRWYKDQPSMSSANPVIVTGGAPAVADQELVPNGQISGTINEIIDGSAALVTAQDTAAVIYPAGSTPSDAESQVAYAYGGNYAIALAPGSYSVAFGSYSSSAGFEAKQYYDRADTAAAAKTVTLAPGATINAVNAVYGADTALGELTAGTPTISGDAQVGATLTAAPGTWSPAGVQFNYQWYRGDAPIDGATTATYVVTSSDVSSKLRVHVSGTLSGFNPGSAQSAATAAIVDLNPGSVRVAVTDETGKPVPSAYVSIIGVSTPVWSNGSTNSAGVFVARNLPRGDYRVVANSSGFQSGKSASASVSVSASTESKTALILVAPTPMPANATLQPSSDTAVPSVSSAAPLTFSVNEAAGATKAEYTVSFERGYATVSGALTESPAGTYSAVIPPLHAAGTGTVTAHFEYATGPAVEVEFSLYIDPSGTVVDENGTPIEGATVTLSRSETETGTFTVIPDGSELLSPRNRTNPVITGADGVFSWDVVPGWYVVTATKNGVTASTAALPVPPEQLGLVLTLDLSGPATNTPGTSGPVTATPGTSGPVTTAPGASDPVTTTPAVSSTAKKLADTGFDGAPSLVAAALLSLGLVLVLARRRELGRAVARTTRH